MKDLKKFFLSLLVFVLILSTPALAAQMAVLKVWVEGEVGVGLGMPGELVVPLGGKNGTWITVKNIGDIDDTIRIEGAFDNPTDWLQFSFKCAETVGECEDIPSSEMHKVDEMRITPEMNQTQFYLEVAAYKKGIGPRNISFTAYSLTEYKKDQVGEIEIRIKSPGGWGIRELPSLSLSSLFVLFLLSCLLFYRKMI